MVRAHCSCMALALSGRKKLHAYLDSTIDIPTEPEYYQALDWMPLSRARSLLLRGRGAASQPSPSPPPPHACSSSPLLLAAAQRETGSILHRCRSPSSPTSQASPSCLVCKAAAACAHFQFDGLREPPPSPWKLGTFFKQVVFFEVPFLSCSLCPTVVCDDGWDYFELLLGCAQAERS
jgi:hypothetical protein